jgi:hypothetical protein
MNLLFMVRTEELQKYTDKYLGVHGGGDQPT